MIFRRVRFQTLAAGIAAGLLLAGAGMAQSLGGLRIHDAVSTTKRLGPPAGTQAMGHYLAQKWVLPNGNDLSVTSSVATGKIVYIESDWGGTAAGAATDFPGLTYGTTSLGDIRTRMGSNGFSYGGRVVADLDDGGGATFNSYDVAGANGVVVTFVTVVHGNEIDKVLASNDFAGGAHLDSISLGAPVYLDEAWGKDRHPSPNYHAVAWP